MKTSSIDIKMARVMRVVEDQSDGASVLGFWMFLGIKRMSRCRPFVGLVITRQSKMSAVKN